MTDSEKLDLLLVEMQSMKAEMQSMKGEMQLMKADMQSMKGEMQSMKAEMQSTKGEMQSMKTNIAGIGLHLENITDRNISILAENHIALIDKLNQAVKVSDKTVLYEIQVNNLSEKVKLLEKRVADLESA